MSLKQNIVVFFQRIASIEVHLGMSNQAFEVPLVDGDTGPKLRFHLLDSDGAAVSVSGSGGVKLYLNRVQSAGHSNLGHESCSGFDLAGGIWDYTLQPGDVSGAGTYLGDVEITFEDGSVETAYEAVRFLVRPHNKI